MLVSAGKKEPKGVCLVACHDLVRPPYGPCLLGLDLHRPHRGVCCLLISQLEGVFCCAHFTARSTRVRLVLLF